MVDMLFNKETKQNKRKVGNIGFNRKLNLVLKP